VSNGDEWTSVVEETPNKLDLTEKGQEFYGIYLGTEEITPENTNDDPFTVHLFREQPGGELYSTSGYKIAKNMKPEHVGHLTRITFMGLVDTGAQQPMKDYRVAVKK